MTYKPGPKVLSVTALRLKRAEERGPSARRTKTLRLLSRDEIIKLQGLESLILAEDDSSKPNTVPAEASVPTKEKTVRKRKAVKAKKTKTTKTPEQRLVEGKKQIAKAKKARKAKPAAVKKIVPALDVAKFMARPIGATPGSPGGASMTELVEQFGIEAHPMRAKIHYIRNQMPGWDVVTKDGRYHATYTENR